MYFISATFALKKPCQAEHLLPLATSPRHNRSRPSNPRFPSDPHSRTTRLNNHMVLRGSSFLLKLLQQPYKPPTNALPVHTLSKDHSQLDTVSQKHHPARLLEHTCAPACLCPYLFPYCDLSSGRSGRDDPSRLFRARD